MYVTLDATRYAVPVVFALASAVPVRYRALVLLATFANMRWGELTALRRANIDACATAGVPGLHFHDLRTPAATTGATIK